MLHCIQFNSCLKQVEGCSAGENASQEWINCQFLILSHHCSVIWVNTWLVTKCQTRWGFIVDYKVWLPSMKAVPSIEYEVSTFSLTASWKQSFMLSTGLHRHTGCLLDCLKRWHTDSVCVQYPTVHFVCVCSIFTCIIHEMCAQIRVWSCLVTDNFGLFTEITVCKFLCGWRSYGLKPFYFVHCMCLYIFLHLFVQRIVP